MEDNKQGMYVLAIVAIIAIVGIVVMIGSVGKGKMTNEAASSRQDAIGQAYKEELLGIESEEMYEEKYEEITPEGGETLENCKPYSLTAMPLQINVVTAYGGDSGIGVIGTEATGVNVRLSWTRPSGNDKIQPSEYVVLRKQIMPAGNDVEYSVSGTATSWSQFFPEVSQVQRYRYFLYAKYPQVCTASNSQDALVRITEVSNFGIAGITPSSTTVNYNQPYQWKKEITFNNLLFNDEVKKITFSYSLPAGSCVVGVTTYNYDALQQIFTKLPGQLQNLGNNQYKTNLVDLTIDYNQALAYLMCNPAVQVTAYIVNEYSTKSRSQGTTTKFSAPNGEKAMSQFCASNPSACAVN